MPEPAAIRTHPFVRAVEAGLVACGVCEAARVVVGVSGGADSVALLRALTAASTRSRWALELSVAHVSHHLRDEAAEDVVFVRVLAGSLGLSCEVADIYPGDESGNLEAAARRLRYAALEKVAVERGGAVVAVAHHADDQLETMLMRLIRGGSPAELAGMRATRRLGEVHLIRPMLSVTRADVIGFLQEIDQPWREDVTNADTARWRARLRAEVLPVLRDLRPDAAPAATRTAGDLARLDDAHRRLARRFLKKHAPDARTLPRAPLRRLPVALAAEVVRQFVAEHHASPPRDAIDTITRLARDHSGEHRQVALTGTRVVRILPDAVTI